MSEDQVAQPTEQQHEVVAIGLWRAVVDVLFAAVLSNVLIYFLLSLALDFPPGFIPLWLSSVAILTGIAALGATISLALLRRFSERPGRIFKRTGWVVLGVSILLLLGAYLQPGLLPIQASTPNAFLMLIPFHLVAGVVIIGLLGRLSST